MSTAPHHDDNHADDEMLSIEEAAAFLRVPVATMRYWRHCGDRTVQLQGRPSRPLLAHRPRPLASRTGPPTRHRLHTDKPQVSRHCRTSGSRW